MCSTVGKGNLCKNKHQCPWGQNLTLDVHSIQLILIKPHALDQEAEVAATEVDCVPEEQRIGALHKGTPKLAAVS